MTEPPIVLAVYGTLRRGEPNDGLLADAEPLGPALVDGRLFEMPLSAERAYAYPSLVRDGPGDVVVELYRLADPAMLATLDELEAFDPADEAGSEYVRRLVDVRDGAVERAWVYVFNGPLATVGAAIDDGDWIAHRRRSG